MSSDILAVIDGALQDYETGPDAMRWNPALGEARQAAVPVTLGSLLHVATGGFFLAEDLTELG